MKRITIVTIAIFIAISCIAQENDGRTMLKLIEGNFEIKKEVNAVVDNNGYGHIIGNNAFACIKQTCNGEIAIIECWIEQNGDKSSYRAYISKKLYVNEIGIACIMDNNCIYFMIAGDEHEQYAYNAKMKIGESFSVRF